MNRDQVRGVAKIVAGKVQEEAGNLIDSAEQIVKGVRKQVAGKAQKGRGDVRKIIKDFNEAHPVISAHVKGKTIRLSWTDGPTKGTTQEHVFHDDGTVEWRPVEDGVTGKAGKASGRPAYAGIDVTDDACMISYLSSSGYTLTVVLNCDDGSTVGIASNEKIWLPVRGSFEVMPDAEARRP
jgi:uncharacterized protein YjbJ (UPF0337 family)